MSKRTLPEYVASDLAVHLANVADNLQLVADMSYGDVALAVVRPDGMLEVVADARPHTAVAPVVAVRVGETLDPDAESEAYACVQMRQYVPGDPRRQTRGMKYSTAAFPIGHPDVVAVVIRDLSEQITQAPGAMESAFMEIAQELLRALRVGPLLDVRHDTPFHTTRRAGDGVMRVDAVGRVTFASPNAVTIMRNAGVEGPIIGTKASDLPGGGFGIAPVVGVRGAIRVDTEVVERVLHYRSIALSNGVLVLVEDRTEARRREAEIKVKEATIREAHHRVKNNLQTIASLLRIQARRTGNDEARRALAEATERVSSMAIVHDLLAGSDDERIDFSQAASTIVDLVSKGLLGDSPRIAVPVSGRTGEVDAHRATSLALVLAELVHNAIEHGFEPGAAGRVEVTMRRVPKELVLTVRDDGRGLPAGFDPSASANLGLEIVRTVIEDDLHGTLGFSAGRGATATVRVPLED